MVYGDYCQQVIRGRQNGYANYSSNLKWREYPFYMIYGFPQFFTWSMNLFSSSLLVAVLLYLGSGTIHGDLHAEKDGNPTGDRVWWKWTSLLSAFSFLSMTLGIVMFYFAMHMLLFNKFPSYSIETTRNHEYGNPLWSGDVLNSFEISIYVWTIGSVVVTLIVLSLATYYRQKVRQRA